MRVLPVRSRRGLATRVPDKPTGRLDTRTTWKYTAALGAVTFLLLIALGSLVTGAMRAERIERARADATARGQQFAAAVESQFAHAVSAAHATAALVKYRAGRAGTVPAHSADVERFAENIVGRVCGVHALELAPDGIIRQAYPLAGNERALGIDLLAEESQREEDLKAIRERSPTIAGPRQLRQGGVGAVVASPSSPTSARAASASGASQSFLSTSTSCSTRPASATSPTVTCTTG